MTVAGPEFGRRGHAAAPGPAGWLSLAAAPTFAFMALWAGFSGAGTDMLCMPMQDQSPLGGMATMYLLMSVFHSASWLKLVRRMPVRRPSIEKAA